MQDGDVIEAKGWRPRVQVVGCAIVGAGAYLAHMNVMAGQYDLTRCVSSVLFLIWGSNLILCQNVYLVALAAFWSACISACRITILAMSAASWISGIEYKRDIFDSALPLKGDSTFEYIVVTGIVLLAYSALVSGSVDSAVRRGGVKYGVLIPNPKYGFWFGLGLMGMGVFGEYSVIRYHSS